MMDPDYRDLRNPSRCSAHLDQTLGFLRLEGHTQSTFLPLVLMREKGSEEPVSPFNMSL